MSYVLGVPSSCLFLIKGSQVVSRAAEWKLLNGVLAPKWQCPRVWSAGQPKLKPMIMTRAQMLNNPSTYSSTISTDNPLYEVPGASFDQYLEDKPRVLKAMFPDKRSSHQLNEEEWRIHMLPIDFLFLTVRPVVDMRLRCKSKGSEYPPGVPCDVTKIIELEIIRTQIEGLDDMLKPSHFSLGVKGVLYPERRGPQSWLISRLQMTVSFDLRAVFSVVPEVVRRQVAESVLRRLMEDMKDNSNLLADYSAFKRETSSN